MSAPVSSNGRHYYRVHISELIHEHLKKHQRRATRQGRGLEFLSAVRVILNKLQNEPLKFGEPIYRLPNLRLKVRTAVVPPISIQFAVSEDRQDVYIQFVRLLSRK